MEANPQQLTVENNDLKQEVLQKAQAQEICISSMSLGVRVDPSSHSEKAPVYTVAEVASLFLERIIR